MEVTSFDKSARLDRTILTGMIVCTPFLSRLSAKYERGLFASKHANMIADWAVNYYRKHGQSPGEHIVICFEEWTQKKAREKYDVESVEKILQSLSESYVNRKKKFDPNALCESAENHFNHLRKVRLFEEGTELMNRGRSEDAHALLAQYVPFDLKSANTVGLLHSQKPLQAAFESRREPIIEYPGMMAKFFGHEFEPDAFVAFMGPNKSSKSFWLLDIAWRAMEQRKRVAYFQVGDISEAQMQQRFACRASRRPLWKKTVTIPIELKRGAEGKIEVRNKTKIFETNLDWQVAWQAYQRVAETKVKSRKDYLRYSVHSTYSINVLGIRNILNEMERIEDFKADVCIIDYADNLGPIDAKEDALEQINKTWAHLRILSTERKCLVVTASQTKASSFNKQGGYLLSRADFSDNRKKLDHPTAIVGINTSRDEKAMQVCRLNWINRRQEDDTSVVHVAGCLAIANPCLLSTF